MYKKYDYNPDVTKEAIVGEVKQIPTSSPYKVYLKHIPRRQSPSTVSIKGFTEVNSIPAEGEFRVLYDRALGEIEFNSADEGKSIGVDYNACGTVVTAEEYSDGREGINTIQESIEEHVVKTSGVHGAGAGTLATREWVNESSDVPNSDHADTAGDSDMVDGKHFSDIQDWVNNYADVPRSNQATSAKNADTVDGYHLSDIQDWVNDNADVPNADTVDGKHFSDIQDWVNGNANVPSARYATKAGDADTVDGKHWNDIQNWITANATVANADNADNADKLEGKTASQILQGIYPVGSVYINASKSTNPATLLGFGTWSRYGAGRVLVGFNSGDGDFNSTGKTGGEKRHKLTINEMPSHKHPIKSDDSGSMSGYQDNALANRGGDSDGDVGWATDSTQAVGGDQSHNNLQPYITVHMWVRTS